MKKPESSRPLLLVNIGQLLTLRPTRPGPRRGPELKNLGIIEDGAVLCLGGKLVAVGTARQALRDPWVKRNRRRIEEIDCQGKVVLPGFVDSHTHPAFVTPRLTDFEKRIAGANYEEIAASGGGIRSSVAAVRRASKEVLASKVVAVLSEMLAQGTTTVEAKSGYGLSLASELKSLEAVGAAAAGWPGTVVRTLLGAHVVPAESTRPEYVKLVCTRMIPEAATKKLAQFVDVFCDRGAFTTEDAKRVFHAARQNGLPVRAHVSQLVRTPIAGLLDFKPASLDHLDQIDASDIVLLSRSNTVATLAPGANYFLGLGKYPPARRLIDAGVVVALATDYNPGSSPTSSMPFVLSLACTQMKMSPAEAIVAGTINAAYGLHLHARKGSIEVGKDADLAVFDATDYREIPYWSASNRCEKVIVQGCLVGLSQIYRSNLEPP